MGPMVTENLDISLLDRDLLCLNKLLFLYAVDGRVLLSLSITLLKDNLHTIQFTS